jgi:glyoxylase-like metal-dependent hydrolase (beta-lactamase superfamily II)
MTRCWSAALPLLALAASAGAAAPQPKIIPGYYGPDRRPDSNSIIYDLPKGLLVIDTGRHEDHVRQILDYAKKRRRPIVAVVNSHWHLDHTGGNHAIRLAYPNVRIYAGEGMAIALRTALSDYPQELERALADPRTPEERKRELRPDLEALRFPGDLTPDVVVDRPIRVRRNGGELELRVARDAATARDVWVLDRATRTIVAGDLVTLPVPFFDSACVEGWHRALDELAAARPVTVIPGHGSAMSAAEFGVYRTAFNRFLECVAARSGDSTCVDLWFSTAKPRTDPETEAQARRLLAGYIHEDIVAPKRQQNVCHL